MPNANATELVKTMKKAAQEAVESGKPVNVIFGTVKTINPLTVVVDQKMELGEKQLILSRNVTDFSTMVTVQWVSESALTTHKHTADGTDTSLTNLAHTHDIVGTKQMTFHWALEVGEEVILLRQQGGQKFIVVDRIGGGST